jgi:hypothetical protein
MESHLGERRSSAADVEPPCTAVVNRCVATVGLALYEQGVTGRRLQGVAPPSRLAEVLPDARRRPGRHDRVAHEIVGREGAVLATHRIDRASRGNLHDEPLAVRWSGRALFELEARADQVHAVASDHGLRGATGHADEASVADLEAEPGQPSTPTACIDQGFAHEPERLVEQVLDLFTVRIERLDERAVDLRGLATAMLRTGNDQGLRVRLRIFEQALRERGRRELLTVFAVFGVFAVFAVHVARARTACCGGKDRRVRARSPARSGVLHDG